MELFIKEFIASGYTTAENGNSYFPSNHYFLLDTGRAGTSGALLPIKYTGRKERGLMALPPHLPHTLFLESPFV